MKKLLISALLLLPAAAYAQELSRTELEAMPARGPEEAAPAPRPDAQKIMSDISTALRLSSKQEERIAAAVGKKAAEFDKLMREYEKNLAEEKKWRYKMNESRHGLLRISRDMPDTVREFLDDEQRESFDAMLEGRKKPAAGPAVAEDEDGAEAAPRPVRKKKLIKRKKAPATGAGAVKPGLKKRVPVKKAAPEPAPEAEEEPAGAAPAAQEAPAEDEDAGSYP
ncbi:MAG TPA: hypothetical protein DEQ38_10715 [Elusimicrobia bacterium]|nr:MAG: hypothetical protein A2089_14565 [Elusimicrobia bacterium GWD2_63_28]HCC48569.1 hypothetical protein [Elusimicrobiota bacterium]